LSTKEVFNQIKQNMHNLEKIFPTLECQDPDQFIRQILQLMDIK